MAETNRKTITEEEFNKIINTELSDADMAMANGGAGNISNKFNVGDRVWFYKEEYRDYFGIGTILDGPLSSNIYKVEWSKVQLPGSNTFYGWQLVKA